MSAQLREAASVILLRRVEPGFEVFLLRRHKRASFMASAFVFPGGASEPAEDARTTAARELFEEAGVLLARVEPSAEARTLEVPIQAQIRRLILDGADAHATLTAARLAWSTETLVPWSHWITPSIEARRFSARFFVCELPPGQVPSFDDIETVDQVWLRPRQALERSGELMLPPPQVRTLWELAQLGTIEEVLAAGRARADEPHPIMPRLRLAPATPMPEVRPCLLLPWDPDYNDGGTGDATPLTYTPSWAVGPSRFVMEDSTWKHVSAPGSTPPA
ncbi:MAG TPA: NUDIX hydrolase [Kofleriaceae bacterium]|jgi:8-oxo-dGTP pyrophosphatase MutT (NUDIX family)|nr:NUDIX hydrolase [Kofleriaceae bacterium]